MSGRSRHGRNGPGSRFWRVGRVGRLVSVISVALLLDDAIQHTDVNGYVVQDVQAVGQVEEAFSGVILDVGLRRRSGLGVGGLVGQRLRLALVEDGKVEVH